MRIKIFVCSIILISLSSVLTSCSGPRITVVGTAVDEKECAMVDTDNGFYFLYSLSEWGDKYVGKKVRVTGKLQIVNHERQSTDSIQVQERVGMIAIIRKPKWKLAE